MATVRACRLARFSRAGFYRKSRARDQSALRLRIREIAHARLRFVSHPGGGRSVSRESPLIEADFAMSGQRVADALEARTVDMPAPVSITVDHGSEFTSKALEN